MIKVKDNKDNIIEVMVCGYDSDDVQIDTAVYEATGEDVSEDVIEYIYNKYSDELYNEWCDNVMAMADWNNDRYEDEYR